VVLEDTTDLLRAQRMAAWEEVARRIAHEIKNPSAHRLVRRAYRPAVDRLALPPDSARILRECTATIASEVESVKTLVGEFSQLPVSPPLSGRPPTERVVRNGAGRIPGPDRGD